MSNGYRVFYIKGRPESMTDSEIRATAKITPVRLAELVEKRAQFSSHCIHPEAGGKSGHG
jgi:hypothetical protein